MKDGKLSNTGRPYEISDLIPKNALKLYSIPDPNSLARVDSLLSDPAVGDIAAVYLAIEGG